MTELDDPEAPHDSYDGLETFWEAYRTRIVLITIAILFLGIMIWARLQVMSMKDYVSVAQLELTLNSGDEAEVTEYMKRPPDDVELTDDKTCWRYNAENLEVKWWDSYVDKAVTGITICFDSEGIVSNFSYTH